MIVAIGTIYGKIKSETDDMNKLLYNSPDYINSLNLLLILMPQ